MDQGQRFKKGEMLFEEGQAIDTIYVVQSGRISLNLNRSGKAIVLEQVGASQILGEQAVAGNSKATYNAEAASEVRLIEIPASLLSEQVQKAPASLKLLVRCLVEEIKRLRQTLKAKIMESDTAPCPLAMIPRAFTLINLVARRSGVEFSLDDGKEEKVFQMGNKKEKETRWEKSGLVLKWSTLKVFATRMFLEAPNRVLGALEIMTKLGYASMYYEEQDEGSGADLCEVCIHNVDIAEQFAEFFQYHYFKVGKSEVIYVDPMAFKVAKGLLLAAEGSEADRRGTVRLEYQEMLKSLKQSTGIDLNNNHLAILEKKGLFVKRSTEDDGVFLSFDLEEFKMTTTFWKIITEIDLWNENGIVDMSTKSSEEDAELGGLICPECDADIKQDDQKFCMECGHRLMAA